MIRDPIGNVYKSLLLAINFDIQFETNNAWFSR